MIAVLSDTHSETGHELGGRAEQAVREADTVLHAGDFTTAAALDAFRDATDTLYAVHGNADTPVVQDSLPDARTVELDTLRVAMTHHRRGGETGLAMFGRQRGADLVVSGHTHRPSVTETDSLTLLNPGSHAEPRGHPVTHAELRADDGAFTGEVLTGEGEVVEAFRVEGRTR